VVHQENLYLDEITEKFSRRTASCITTERTDCLVVDGAFSQSLYQPTAQAPKTSKTGDKSGDKFDRTHDAANEDQDHAQHAERGSLCDSTGNDRLSDKVRILQAMPYLNDIDPKYLMRIAANLVTKTYSYGEYLVKQGQVPKGLFLILKGQCKVLATRIAKRSLIENQSRANHQQVVDKQWQTFIHDPTVHDFNPTTSVLNQVNSNKRLYQNQRVLIDDKHAEIKKSIQYLDIMAFS